MKKTISLFILIFCIGVFSGYYWKVLQEGQQITLEDKRNRLLQVRTEEYEPSCTELRNTNKPTLTTRGSDHYIVIVRKTDFFVVGLNSEAGKAPITAWWGAELSNALRQSCE